MPSFRRRDSIIIIYMESFDISKVNLENLRRKFAFQSGVSFVSAPEHDQKKALKRFDRVPDVLPIKFKSEK